MIYFILSMLSGVTVVLSRVINYLLAQRIGTYQSTFFNFLLGFLGSCLLFFISSEALANILVYQSLPWWVYVGGLIGVVSVTLSSFLSAKLPAFYLALLIFTGQLFTGIVIDYVKTQTLSLLQILGGILVVMGLCYNLYQDEKSATK